MCGINGIFNHLKLNDSRSQVLKMNQLSGHRGPDNQGVFQDESVILGHTRLSIIDVDARSNQPFISADRSVVVSFNGEIYNFQKLKNELKEYSFITQSDTEVVVAAYLKWGISFLAKLDGMFAIALWDKRTNNLVLARDKMGIKPLYYFQKNNTVVFSSEIRSILSCEIVDRKLNFQALEDYLNYSTVHAPNTIVDGIKLLPSGHFIEINEDDFILRSFWDVRDNFKVDFAGLSLLDIQKDVRNLFFKSVEKRLISDVPFGAFLSGGIDSSAVVAAASKVSDKPIKTFCVAFKDHQFDESKYARIVSDLYKTDHHEILLSPNQLLDDLPSALSSMDHPSGDGPNSFVVSKAAKSAGVSMVLSGLGGDELFAGYDIFNKATQLLDKKWFFSFPPGVRNFIGLILRALKPSISSDKIAEIITQKYLELIYFYPIYRKLFTEKDLKKLISLTKVNLTMPFLLGEDKLSSLSGEVQLPFLSKVSFLEMNTYMQHVLLRDTDQMSMAHSLEVRVPMLDVDLVEYVYGVKDQYKMGANPKQLLVGSLGELLPESIVNRPKMGFLLPWDKWMKKELKEFNISKLEYLKNLKIFNSLEIDSIWNKFENNNPRYSWSKIWSLVVLGNWLEDNKIEI